MKKNYLLVLLLVTCEYVLSQDLTNLKSKAESGDNNAQYELACEYLNTNTPNYIEVLNLLRKSAKSGNTKAKQLLSELSAPGHNGWGDTYLLPQYDDGVLSEKNYKIVEQYATKGCSSSTCKGHKGYLLILAHSYYHEKKYAKAVYYYKMALSQMKQGNLGKYGDEDFDLYKAWFDAYSMLGYCYEHGYGVEKDLKTALDYYLIGGIYIDEGKYDISGIKRIIKEINNPELTKDLFYEDGEHTNGLQYYDGQVPSPFAIRSWEKAGAICAKLGKFDLAKEFLCEDIFEHNGAIRDLWVGEMFYKGYGRPQNYPKAYEYFNYIVNEMEGPWGVTEVYEYYPDVYADACYRLYECYAFGRGVTKDSAKAEYYFRLALKFGSSSAIYDDQKRYEIADN